MAGFALSQGVDLDRLARETSLEQRNTAASLDAHIAQERETAEKVMGALNEIQGDLRVVKYRLDESPR